MQYKGDIPKVQKKRYIKNMKDNNKRFEEREMVPPRTKEKRKKFNSVPLMHTFLIVIIKYINR